MRKSFKFATAALLAAAAIGLVACSSSKKDNKTADSKGGDYRVEVIAKGF